MKKRLDEENDLEINSPIGEVFKLCAEAAAK